MRAQNLIPLLLLALAACKPSGEKELSSLKDQKAQLELQLEEVSKKIKELEKASGKVVVQQKTIFVEVKPLANETFKHFLDIQGHVTTDNNVSVSPRTGGLITKVNVKKGDNVSKGQLLATIDVSALYKGKEELKSALEFANTVFEKQQALWDQKIGTEIQYLQAKNNKESLEKKIATLNEQIAFGSITAPASGVIEEVYSREGESAAPGMPMFRLIGKGEFKILADVSEAYASSIKEGNEAEVYFPDLDKTIKTTVKVVGDEISALNRTFNIELYLPQSSPSIKANMIAYVKVKDYEVKNKLVIPVKVIQKAENGTTFAFVEADGKAAKRTVVTGKDYKGNVEVVSGLQQGDKLIVTGYMDLIEGQPVSSK